MLAIIGCPEPQPDVGSYTCSNGTATSGNPDGSDDVESCARCDSGYERDGNRCVAVQPRLTGLSFDIGISCLRIYGDLDCHQPATSAGANLVVGTIGTENLSGTVSYTIREGDSTSFNINSDGEITVGDTALENLTEDTEYSFMVVASTDSQSISGTVTITNTGIPADAASPERDSNSDPNAAEITITDLTSGCYLDSATCVQSEYSGTWGGFFYQFDPVDTREYGVLHIAYNLSSAATGFRVALEPVGDGQSVTDLTAADHGIVADGTWQTVNVDVGPESPHNEIDRTQLDVVGFWNQGTNNTLIIDEVYFATDSTTDRVRPPAIYTCANGTEQQTGNPPGEDNVELCTSCEDGYTLNGVTCDANIYTCDNGTWHEPGTDGTADGVTASGEYCMACNPGYELDGTTCVVATRRIENTEINLASCLRVYGEQECGVAQTAVATNTDIGVLRVSGFANTTGLTYTASGGASNLFNVHAGLGTVSVNTPGGLTGLNSDSAYSFTVTASNTDGEDAEAMVTITNSPSTVDVTPHATDPRGSAADANAITVTDLDSGCYNNSMNCISSVYTGIWGGHFFSFDAVDVTGYPTLVVAYNLSSAATGFRVALESGGTQTFTDLTVADHNIVADETWQTVSVDVGPQSPYVGSDRTQIDNAGFWNQGTNNTLIIDEVYFANVSRVAAAPAIYTCANGTPTGGAPTGVTENVESCSECDVGYTLNDNDPDTCDADRLVVNTDINLASCLRVYGDQDCGVVATTLDADTVVGQLRVEGFTSTDGLAYTVETGSFFDFVVDDSGTVSVGATDLTGLNESSEWMFDVTATTGSESTERTTVTITNVADTVDVTPHATDPRGINADANAITITDLDSGCYNNSMNCISSVYTGGWGGHFFNFDAVDVTGYPTLVIAYNLSSAATGFRVTLESGGTQTFTDLTAADHGIVADETWQTVSVDVGPQSPYVGSDRTQIDNVGFWNQGTNNTLIIDEIYFAGASRGAAPEDTSDPEYTCDGGTPTDGVPDGGSDVESCSDCDPGYTLNSDDPTTCDAHVYMCNGGTAPTPGSVDAADGAEYCEFCNPGYELDGTTCVEDTREVLNTDINLASCLRVYGEQDCGVQQTTVVANSDIGIFRIEGFDSTAGLTYSISGGSSSLFAVHAGLGIISVGDSDLTGLLDTTAYSFTVTASNTNGEEAEAMVTITNSPSTVDVTPHATDPRGSTADANAITVTDLDSGCYNNSVNCISSVYTGIWGGHFFSFDAVDVTGYPTLVVAYNLSSAATGFRVALESGGTQTFTDLTAADHNIVADETWQTVSVDVGPQSPYVGSDRTQIDNVGFWNQGTNNTLIIDEVYFANVSRVAAAPAIYTCANGTPTGGAPTGVTENVESCSECDVGYTLDTDNNTCNVNREVLNTEINLASCLRVYGDQDCGVVATTLDADTVVGQLRVEGFTSTDGLAYTVDTGSFFDFVVDDSGTVSVGASDLTGLSEASTWTFDVTATTGAGADTATATINITNVADTVDVTPHATDPRGINADANAITITDLDSGCYNNSMNCISSVYTGGWGGHFFNFDAVDVTGYPTLVIAYNLSSAATGFRVTLESGGTQTFTDLTAADHGIVADETWQTVSVDVGPQSPYVGSDRTQIDNVGFWNQGTNNTLIIDEIYFAGASRGAAPEDTSDPEYTCDGGTPTDGVPDGGSDVESCSDCDPGYTLNSDDPTTCDAHVYMCNGGTAPTPGSVDAADGAEYCEFCNPGYELDGTTCVEDTREVLNTDINLASCLRVYGEQDCGVQQTTVVANSDIGIFRIEGFDSTAGLTYSISGGSSSLFAVHAGLGIISVGDSDLTGLLDTTAYSFTVTASNTNGEEAEAMVTITNSPSTVDVTPHATDPRGSTADANAITVTDLDSGCYNNSVNCISSVYTGIWGGHFFSFDAVDVTGYPTLVVAYNLSSAATGFRVALESGGTQTFTDLTAADHNIVADETWQTVSVDVGPQSPYVGSDRTQIDNVGFWNQGTNNTLIIDEVYFANVSRVAAAPAIYTCANGTPTGGAPTGVTENVESCSECDVGYTLDTDNNTCNVNREVLNTEINLASCLRVYGDQDCGVVATTLDADTVVGQLRVEGFTSTDGLAYTVETGSFFDFVVDDSGTVSVGATDLTGLNESSEWMFDVTATTGSESTERTTVTITNVADTVDVTPHATDPRGINADANAITITDLDSGCYNNSMNCISSVYTGGWGGHFFNFDAVDVTGYPTLVIAYNLSSAATGFRVTLESGGTQTFTDLTAADHGIVADETWQTVSVDVGPQSPYVGSDRTQIDNVGFWNQGTNNTLIIDEIYFAGASRGAAPEDTSDPEYTCDGGTPTDGVPDGGSDVESCSDCDPGYTLNSDDPTTCDAHVYMCNGGTAPTPGSVDAADGAEYCEFCNPGYELDGTTCVEDTREVLNTDINLASCLRVYGEQDCGVQQTTVVANSDIGIFRIEGFDSTAGLTYSISGGSSSLFAVHAGLGIISVGDSDLTGLLDTTAYSFTVTASNTNGEEAEAMVTITNSPSTVDVTPHATDPRGSTADANAITVTDLDSGCYNNSVNCISSVYTGIWGGHFFSFDAVDVTGYPTLVVAYNLSSAATGFRVALESGGTQTFTDLTAADHNIVADETWQTVSVDVGPQSPYVGSDRTQIDNVGFWNQGTNNTLIIDEVYFANVSRVAAAPAIYTCANGTPTGGAPTGVTENVESCSECDVGYTLDTDNNTCNVNREVLNTEINLASCLRVYGDQDCGVVATTLDADTVVGQLRVEGFTSTDGLAYTVDTGSFFDFVVDDSGTVSVGASDLTGLSEASTWTFDVTATTGAGADTATATINITNVADTVDVTPHATDPRGINADANAITITDLDSGCYNNSMNCISSVYTGGWGGHFFNFDAVDVTGYPTLVIAYNLSSAATGFRVTLESGGTQTFTDLTAADHGIVADETWQTVSVDVGPQSPYVGSDRTQIDNVGFWNQGTNNTLIIDEIYFAGASRGAAP